MVLDVVICTAAVEDIGVTTWKRGVAEKVVGDLVLFLGIGMLVRRINSTEYYVRTFEPRLEVGRALGFPYLHGRLTTGEAANSGVSYLLLSPYIVGIY